MMKARLMIIVVVVMMAGQAWAGLFSDYDTVQEYFQNGPELVVHENGTVALLNYAKVKVSSKYAKDAFLIEKQFWNGQAHSVLYDHKTHILVALTSNKGGQITYHAYSLKAEPMQRLLAAISANWKQYKDYIEDPTAEKEVRIKTLADVTAALASVQDHVVKKDLQFSPDELKDPDLYAAKLKILRDDPRITDPRLVERRDASFWRFLKAEGMTDKTRGGSMFAIKVTEKEAAAGATTRVQLYYVGAWLNAVADDYRPKQFEAVAISFVPEQTSQARMLKNFTDAVAAEGK